MKAEDMIAPTKFKAACWTCEAEQKRATTRWTSEKWMKLHEDEHRAGGAA